MPRRFELKKLTLNDLDVGDERDHHRENDDDAYADENDLLCAQTTFFVTGKLFLLLLFFLCHGKPLYCGYLTRVGI